MANAKTINEKLTAWALKHLDGIFTILRVIKPTVVFKGNAVVTRFDDVTEVLNRDWIFQVPYAEKMHKVTNGSNFFLGMQNTEQYTRDVSNMRIAARREDIDTIVKPFVDKTSEEILKNTTGRMDVVQQLTRVVPTRLIGEYFGTPGWNETEFTDAATIMFQYLFYPDDPEVEEKALKAAEQTRSYLDQAIAERKANPVDKDDVLGRCLKLQQAGMPGMSDIDIRNNLIGLIIGAIPTTSKCAAVTLNHLFDNPELLVEAQQAARADEDEKLAQYVLESLRLNPFAAGIQRVCAEDYVVAKGTLRSTTIPKGTRVLAATQSAMKDGRKIKKPKEFRLDRPAYSYMHFGFGLHTCFGQYINMTQIPGIVKAVLKQNTLRRAADMVVEEPFPVSLEIEYDN
ncbi:cytochrome P450 [Nitrosomonas sp.]|uniref:cytochrome P450 n=1 Tax=Nitrosomonas sp. TaxID=42353 RepID=UPI00284F999C|nr:cytochrome P450 [Nitrosomonas sp.]MCP5243298.1 cytochrome P450 [Burkholderiales bacterium]MDR4515425.1 cytochrome P450 [Nitrosomonas sp.]